MLPIQPLKTPIPQYVEASSNRSSGLGKKIISLKSLKDKGTLGADFYSKISSRKIFVWFNFTTEFTLFLKAVVFKSIIELASTHFDTFQYQIGGN